MSVWWPGSDVGKARRDERSSRSHRSIVDQVLADHIDLTDRSADPALTLGDGLALRLTCRATFASAAPSLLIDCKCPGVVAIGQIAGKSLLADRQQTRRRRKRAGLRQRDERRGWQLQLGEERLHGRQPCFGRRAENDVMSVCAKRR
jgi:hypothetical protein